jgi:hypothetical protein
MVLGLIYIHFMIAVLLKQKKYLYKIV